MIKTNPKNSRRKRKKEQRTEGKYRKQTAKWQIEALACRNNYIKGKQFKLFN